MKTLYSISWQVTEPEYRADPALSYSTLAKFSRDGFNKLNAIFNKIETPSIIFGSAVDALITGGQEEFEKNFIVTNLPEIAESAYTCVTVLYNKYKDIYTNLIDIPPDILNKELQQNDFWPNSRYSAQARINGFFKYPVEELYHIMLLAGNRIIINKNLYIEIKNTVNVLKTSDVTSFYFFPNNPWDKSIERFYQLKFKASFSNIDYRCMADLIIVDNKTKIIYPVDLKTSSHTEWDFYKSFIDYSYQIQARLYWRIIRDNLDKDEIFKDYTLADYTFIVINRKTLTPLVWQYEDTQKYGTLYYGKNNQIEFPEPFDLGKQLSFYLSSRPQVPEGIKQRGLNYITEWLNKLK